MGLKAQSSLEFLIVFCILLIVFGLVATESYLRSIEISDDENRVYLKQVCADISRAVVFADSSYNGYSQIIRFRETLNVSVLPAYRELEINGKERCLLLAANISSNVSMNDMIRIRKINDMVQLE